MNVEISAEGKAAGGAMEEERRKRLEEFASSSLLATHNLFLHGYGGKPSEYAESLRLRCLVKMNDEFPRQKPTLNEASHQSFDAFIEQQLTRAAPGKVDPFEGKQQQGKAQAQAQGQPQKTEEASSSALGKVVESAAISQEAKLSKIPSKFMKKSVTTAPTSDQQPAENAQQLAVRPTGMPVFNESRALARVEEGGLGSVLSLKIKKMVKPRWHAPWKLMRVIAGHQGWVTCLDVDPSNKFFVTGSKDRTIKFWDLASGQLKLSLTGHINTVRGLAISGRHTYLFSCGEDKMVKCWDLETNKVVRDYHGHLSGVYSLALHPTLDVLATGGRDSVVRLWDIRTKAQIHVLEGHTNAIASLIAQEYEPQLVSGSHDTTVRLWDIGTGRSVETLTNHKKAVRGMCFHHSEYTFATAAADNLKVWKCPEGTFLRNISGHNGIVNAVAVNEDDVLASCGDNGSLYMWDWKSGYNFQQLVSKPQPGSISSEAGIFAAKFDRSSMRLITAECDKSIKMWKEDENATPETHPIDPNFRVAFDSQRF